MGCLPSECCQVSAALAMPDTCPMQMPAVAHLSLCVMKPGATLACQLGKRCRADTWPGVCRVQGACHASLAQFDPVARRRMGPGGRGAMHDFTRAFPHPPLHPTYHSTPPGGTTRHRLYLGAASSVPRVVKRRHLSVGVVILYQLADTLISGHRVLCGWTGSRLTGYGGRRRLLCVTPDPSGSPATVGFAARGALGARGAHTREGVPRGGRHPPLRARPPSREATLP